MHRIFWIVLILFCGVIIARNDECERKNTAFASSNADFIQCVTNHDKNASYCLECAKQYSVVAKAHFDLTHDDPSGPKCRPDYVDNNLLNLVDFLMSNTRRIWDLAICSDCFDGNCDETTPSTANCVKSNRTKDFVSLYNQAFDCINNEKEQSCHICNEQYNNLTKQYNKIHKQTADKFCFDLKNMMNQTQKLWSVKYRCCNDKTPPAIEFYALSAATFFIAVFFYAAAFFYGRRKLEIQYIPDDLLPIDHPRSANDSSVSLSDNEQPCISANMPEPSPKLIESTDETDDDDDQPILSNQSLIEIS